MISMNNIKSLKKTLKHRRFYHMIYTYYTAQVILDGIIEKNTKEKNTILASKRNTFWKRCLVTYSYVYSQFKNTEFSGKK